MTLVEVMVVVFIIGLTSSLGILTMPERADPAERATDDFARDVRQVADRAILTGRVQGIDLTDEGYGIAQWNGQWMTAPTRISNRAGPIQMRVIGAVEDNPLGQPELEAGFSLVETVAALGILAMAAIPLLQISTDATKS